jgi:hypothetical protein
MEANYKNNFVQKTNFGQKRIILRLEAGSGRSGSCHYCHLLTASNFSGEKAKGAFTLPLPPGYTFIMYSVK